MLRSYIGLLNLGKSGFEAVENIREDEFFAEALGVSAVTPHQRFDARVMDFLGMAEQASVDFLYGLPDMSNFYCLPGRTGGVPDIMNIATIG